jgi:hypothetical protein
VTNVATRRQTGPASPGAPTEQPIVCSRATLGELGTRAAPVQQVARPFPLSEVLDVCPTILTVGYMVSRGLAKSGSRDPYDADDNDR